MPSRSPRERIKRCEEGALIGWRLCYQSVPRCLLPLTTARFRDKGGGTDTNRPDARPGQESRMAFSEWTIRSTQAQLCRIALGSAEDQHLGRDTHPAIQAVGPTSCERLTPRFRQFLPCKRSDRFAK